MTAPGTEQWEFAGWGKAEKLTNLNADVSVHHLDHTKKHLLGSWKATAICGNDISSSCLYVSALCAAQAGIYAPVVLLIVAGVLFLFQKVYAEVGSALPLNGGTFTVLLNTTNKRLAAGAACLTLLSYMATAVISANEAMHYAHTFFEHMDIMNCTVLLLTIFAVLAFIGIGESAVVALVIFIFHLVTLTVLCILATVTILNDPTIFTANLRMPQDQSILKALFFGFAAAMLGISGFESSANFIEEQKVGVFAKTLRNMWIVVAIFNPLIALLSIGLLDLNEIKSVPPNLLSRMGEVSLGKSLAYWISFDAVLVLSGAVLTSFVGVIGLVRRMSLDRCLPQFLLNENKLRGTNHWIILGFLAICISILFVTKGDIATLAGVYTLSFLSVMALFAVGNMFLKSKRSQLPRDTIASWPKVSIALVAVLVGILGNILLDPLYLQVFGTYYFFAGLGVAVMFLRVQILKVLLLIFQAFVQKIQTINNHISSKVIHQINKINELKVIYFTGGDAGPTLNDAALYVIQNEQTHHLIVVHVYEKEEDIPKQLAKHLETIDHLYPKLRVDFLAVKGTFGPQIIEALSNHLGVPKNYMFIGTPGDRFPHRIEELGGVRLIL